MDMEKKIGGYRPGAGRPKGKLNPKTVAKQKRQEMFEKALFEAVMKEKKPIIDGLIESAKKGNVIAVKEIIDRILGKAQDHVDVTSNGESITVVSVNFDEVTDK
jgi:hypothetical protein